MPAVVMMLQARSYLMGGFEDFSRQHGSKELPQGIGHDDEAQELSPAPPGQSTRP